MIIKCKICSQEFDSDLFPICPYCLSPSNINRSADAGESPVSAAKTIFKLDTLSAAKETDDRNSDAVSEEERSNLPIDDKPDSINDQALHFEEKNDEEQEDTDSNGNEKSDILLSEILEFPLRVKNALFRNGIFTLYDLLSFVDSRDISELHNIGAKTSDEINKIIRKYKTSGFTIIGTTKDEKNTNKIPIITNSFFKRTLYIQDAFSESKFRIFVNYCAQNGIVTVADLQGFNFFALRTVPGIGISKVGDIILRYKGVCSFLRTSGQTDFVPEGTDFSRNCIFENINEQLRELDISFLSGLGIGPKQYKSLQDNGIDIVGDLEGISLTKLSEIVGKRYIDKFLEISQMLQENIFILLEKKLSSYSDQKEYMLTLFRAEGLTFKEIGELAELSRERVHQLVEKFLESLNPFMDLIIKILMNHKEFITVQELIDIYDNDDYDKILILWCKTSGHLHYFDYADIFLLQEYDVKKMESDLQSIADELIGEGTNINKHIDDISDALQRKGLYFFDVDAFILFLLHRGYKLYGDYIVQGRQSYASLCARIVAKNFTEGIKLYDSHDLELLRKYAMEEYGAIGIPSSNKALSSRLAGYLILRDRGVYTSEENIYVQQQLIDELKSYIDNRPEAEIYYSDLFGIFEGMIRMMSSIDNYHYLHGVLKLYFADIYDFSSKAFLTKRGEGLSSGKLSDRLKMFILDTKKPVHKKEITTKFPGTTDIVLISSVSYDKSLFQWDYNTFSSLDIISISCHEKELLRESIARLLNCNNGYCSSKMLFTEINRILPEFIEHNHITNENNLFFLCAKLFAGYFDFRRPHICRTGLLDSMSVKSVALHMLKDPSRLNYRDYQQLSERLQWSTVTTNLLFLELEKDYFRINADDYIKLEDVDISPNDLEIIENHMEFRLSRGFLSLFDEDFDGYPEIKYEWNSFLLRSIIDKFFSNYKIVEQRQKDRRFERGIVLRADSTINNYVELVIWLMKKNGFTELSENKMLSLLVVNGLTYKIIPKELYASDKLIFRNEMFSILD